VLAASHRRDLVHGQVYGHAAGDRQKALAAIEVVDRVDLAGVGGGGVRAGGNFHIPYAELGPLGAGGLQLFDVLPEQNATRDAVPVAASLPRSSAPSGSDGFPTECIA